MVGTHRTKYIKSHLQTTNHIFRYIALSKLLGLHSKVSQISPSALRDAYIFEMHQNLSLSGLSRPYRFPVTDSQALCLYIYIYIYMYIYTYELYFYRGNMRLRIISGKSSRQIAALRKFCSYKFF